MGGLSLAAPFTAADSAHSGLSKSFSLISSPALVSLTEEINKRRTFAIISHPDAGKTTLTEKLLLYGGGVQLAGSVTARKNQRASTSDWMELERKRGISVSSTVLQFQYEGFSINLLDTPGHKDFSEDTYRVLTAVDAAVMVIDAGKGIESQTKKLFEVCRQRSIPIFTFMNKCDRPVRDPLSLLDELESVLGIQSYPVNWPIGNGIDFKGVYDRLTSTVNLFERTAGGVYRAPVSLGNFSDPFIRERLDDALYETVSEELEMLEMAGAEFSEQAVLAGETTPVFYGSAMNNFGVKLLLDGFLNYSPPPQARNSESQAVAPDSPNFSAFIFKIQANMDPRHRDRIAFIRICSGKFERDMTVTHPRSGKKVRLSSSHKLFGNDRETVNEAYAGDIVGLVGLNDFGIGDTLTNDPSVQYSEIPRFTPETFAYLHNANTGKFKQFRQGLDQLLQEGVIQVLHLNDTAVRVPLLAAVGQLQFEVVQYRLETEYNAESRLETTPWEAVRWLPSEFKEKDVESLQLPTGSRIAWDVDDQAVVLFPTEWTINYFTETNKGIRLSQLPHASEAILDR
ncbi:MAG: Peptide chain release factor 3 [Verrucomicrobia subdivision 3 bacterium]|nr:Peptide chain release factor 3 [Limisphaerales bacterium]MCS1415396.1 Peptide chain release factor 3 [Limisphaerales bacterium]